MQSMFPLSEGDLDLLNYYISINRFKWINKYLYYKLSHFGKIYFSIYAIKLLLSSSYENYHNKLIEEGIKVIENYISINSKEPRNHDLEGNIFNLAVTLSGGNKLAEICYGIESEIDVRLSAIIYTIYYTFAVLYIGTSTYCEHLINFIMEASDTRIKIKLASYIIKLLTEYKEINS